MEVVDSVVDLIRTILRLTLCWYVKNQTETPLLRVFVEVLSGW